MTANKSGSATSFVDPDDAPELTEAWFQEADLHVGGALVRKGGRPKAESTKVPVSLRLDPDVVAFFKASGPGWQSRINASLRRAMMASTPAGAGRSKLAAAIKAVAATNRALAKAKREGRLHTKSPAKTEAEAETSPPVGPKPRGYDIAGKPIY